MEFDFEDIVPPGTYRCRIAEVRPATTRSGEGRWSLRLVVTDGPYAGKQAAWDSIIFSTRGGARARMVLNAFGFPAIGKVQIEPADIEGREATVTVKGVRYQTPLGKQIETNEVPYDGYQAVTPP